MSTSRGNNDDDEERDSNKSETTLRLKNHNKYRKDKPWDNDQIDHWKNEPWDEEKDQLPGGRLLDESSFATLFPKYRESYLRQVWPVVTKALDSKRIACELNLIEGSMTVRTTSKTSDPYIILKARDLLKLLSRSIPVAQALKILNDEWVCDIVKIGGLVRNKERFIKRRQRLIGQEGSTLKALELVTGCFILVQGNTVSIMGQTYHGLKQARNVVVDCMNNIHPIYHIKRLMIMKELAKDDKLKNEDWDRFLPKFKKKNVQRKKPVKTKTTSKAYTPFPPAQTPRKVDLQLDTGEFFATEEQRKARQLSAKKAQAKETSLQKRLQREDEADAVPNRSGKRIKASSAPDSEVDLQAFKKNMRKGADAPTSQMSDFVKG